VAFGILCFVQLTDVPNFVATTVLSNFIESCYWNIIQTDVQTVEETIQNFNISVEIVSIYSVEISIILNELITVSCPGQPMCGDHGSCDNGFCVCDTGQYFFQLLPAYRIVLLRLTIGICSHWRMFLTYLFVCY